MIDSLLKLMEESEEFTATVKAVARNVRIQSIYGLSGSDKTYLVAALYRSLSRPIFLVTYSAQQARRLEEDLKTFLGMDEVFLFPPRETLPHEETTREAREVLSVRAGAWKALLAGRQCIIVAPAESLMRKTMPKSVVKELLLNLKVAGTIEHERLLARLSNMGYERVDEVRERGQFAVRGDIIDVYPIDARLPYRIELFGDEIDSIRLFDPANQRSIASEGSCLVGPAREFLVMPGVLEEGLARIRQEVAALSPERRKLAEKVESHLDRLGDGIYFDGDEQYLPLFYPDMELPLEYFAEDGLLILHEPARIREALMGAAARLREDYFSLLERGEILPSQGTIFATPEEVIHSFEKFRALWLILLSKGGEHAPGSIARSFLSRPAEPQHGKFDLLAKELKSRRRLGYRVVIFLSGEERAQRFVEIMRDEGVEAVFAPNPGEEIKPGNVVVTIGQLESGFEFPSLRLMVLSDTEVYGVQKRRRRIVPIEEGARIAAYTDLAPGDYVVHVNHGIGKYIGVETMEVAGTKRDYLVVQYAGQDRLYVPTDQVHQLQKYIGPEETPPKLYKLGGSEWNKVKSRVKESVRDIAQKLVELYAARETIPGHAFSPDTVWQKEFEEAFPYEETPDQRKAIEEIKRDMERPRPMDRLLCGDVGYGKTEVAIRAAFKAVMDGKQVAVLVPTTILAQQHYTTFRERCQNFPVSVAVLSRFQSPKQQAEVIKGLRQGSIDIVIGTHRLLQDDVKFRDLGLLVVDEEQRFGVAHKEKLKELRKSVDVLTLTATPIPRTLHMSLVGVRDMSTIETPPEDRFPVRTYVTEFDEGLIREAILKELDRDGQVYFVHNRVQTIDAMAAYLSKLVPEARIAVAHGQMPEDRLERVMLQFLDREYDVLVCTTIIENGLDIPNVNTLIVTDADHLGLAQLYQLRGRVGRSNRVAYAYFMYRKDRVLTEVAEKRLEAIKEFTDLGAGFKIAMRDLEIRGAGNLLGPEQHGHIASVGFELYTRLLQEAVAELRGTAKKQEIQEFEPSIELPVNAFIPDDYIGDPKQKIEIYKKINAIASVEDAYELEEELCDRFGEAPLPVKNLLSVARIKALARTLGVGSLCREKEYVVIKFTPFARVTPNELMNLVRSYRGRVFSSFSRIPALRVKAEGVSEAEVLALIERVMSDVGQVQCAASG